MTIKSFEALANGETLELRIYGPIGRGIFSDGINAESISEAISAAGNVKTIVVRMSCPGGSAFDGMAIRSMLAGHAAHKTCEIEGLAASAGSIIAMGCDVVRMHTGGAFMIHEASAYVEGQADDLRKAMDALEALNDGMATIYAARTGMSKDKCRKMMADETWLTPEQAQKKGFADEVVPAKTKIAASFDLSKFGYAKVPEEFKAEQPPEQDDDEEEDSSEADKSAEPKREEAPPPAAQEISPPSAAQNAEASADRKRLNTMTIKLVATAIGLSADADESAVVAAVSQLNAFASELRTLVKADSNAAVLGAIRGLQASAEQVPVLQAQLKAAADNAEAQERAQLIAADKTDPKGRRLTPAVEELAAKWPLDMLKAYLEKASHVIKMESTSTTQQQPALQTTDAASGVAIVTHNGKSWEAMAPGEKADLYHEDKARYDELKRNHAERGSPRAQSQQQRASA